MYLTTQPAAPTSGVKLPVLPEAGATSMISSRSRDNSPPAFIDPAARIPASSMPVDPFFTQPATPVDEAGHLGSPESVHWQRPTDDEDCVHGVLDGGSCPDDKESGFIAPSQSSMWSVFGVYFFCFLLTG